MLIVFKYIFYRFPSRKQSHTTENSINIQQIITVFLYLLTDIIFFFLLAYSNYKTKPDKVSKFKNISYLSRNYYDGFIQTFLFGILPVINAIINYDVLRKVIFIYFIITNINRLLYFYNFKKLFFE